jgi:hypothetical protein
MTAGERQQPPPLRVIAGLAAAAAVALFLANLWSATIVGALLPAVEAEIRVLDPDLNIGAMEMMQDGTQDLVTLRADVSRPTLLAGRVVTPLGFDGGRSGWFRVRLSARGVLQAPLIFLVLLLGWPVSSPSHAIRRCLLGLPLLALLLAVDAPLDLLANLWEVAVHHVDPNAQVSLFAWAKFMEGGGSAALALAFAVVAIGASAPRRALDRVSPAAQRPSA